MKLFWCIQLQFSVIKLIWSASKSQIGKKFHRQIGWERIEKLAEMYWNNCERRKNFTTKNFSRFQRYMPNKSIYRFSIIFRRNIITFSQSLFELKKKKKARFSAERNFSCLSEVFWLWLFDVNASFPCEKFCASFNFRGNFEFSFCAKIHSNLKDSFRLWVASSNYNRLNE